MGGGGYYFNASGTAYDYVMAGGGGGAGGNGGKLDPSCSPKKLSRVIKIEFTSANTIFINYADGTFETVGTVSHPHIGSMNGLVGQRYAIGAGGYGGYANGYPGGYQACYYGYQRNQQAGGNGRDGQDERPVTVYGPDNYPMSITLGHGGRGGNGGWGSWLHSSNHGRNQGRNSERNWGEYNRYVIIQSIQHQFSH